MVISFLPRLIAAAFLVIGRPAYGHIYVTNEDHRVARLAKDATVTHCNGRDFIGTIQKDVARRTVEDGVGSNNIMLQILKDAKSQSDLGNVASNKLTVGWGIQKGGAIVLSIIIIFIWFICCWTACPCCKCCRICRAREPKHTPGIFKLALLIVFLGLLVGIIASAGLAFRGYNQAKDGFENMACTSSLLLNATLSGKTSPSFIGMLPLLNVFWDLDQRLNNNSTFLNDATRILTRTQPINDALKVASETLKLLKMMMQDPANNQPRDTNGISVLHKCEFCSKVIAPLDSAIQVLESGIGKALANARNEVDKQLTPTKRADLQNTLRTSLQPLKQLKDTTRSTLGFFVETDKFSKMKDQVNGQVPTVLLGCVFIMILALLLLSCAGWSLGCFTLCEKRKRGSSTSYQPWTHRCACCSWCCAFFYAGLALLLGGLLTAVNVALSGTCLVMDDINAPMLHSISPALGMNLSGTGGTMVTSFIDQCFAGTNSSNPNMLDMMFVVENGTRVSVRTKMVGQVKHQISGQFAKISQRDNVSSASSAQLIMLRGMLRNNTMDAMLVPDESVMRQTTPYNSLVLDTRPNGIATGYLTSCKCNNHTVGPGLGSLSGQSLPGINNFVQALSFFGTLNSHSSCAQKVTCFPHLSPDQDTACQAGNRLIDVKHTVIGMNTFKCRWFATPGTGSQCDVLNMVQVGGVWTNDCLQNDGTMTTMERSCTLAQYTQYIRDFDTRIRLVFERLDATSQALQSRINVDLQNLVNRDLVNPIGNAAAGVTCGFIGVFYQQMIDGLCYQGVVGLIEISQSYLACGVLSIILILLMYIVWRRSIDNYNQKSHTEVKPFTLDEPDTCNVQLDPVP